MWPCLKLNLVHLVTLPRLPGSSTHPSVTPADEPRVSHGDVCGHRRVQAYCKENVFLTSFYLRPEEDHSILVETSISSFFSPFVAGIGESFTASAPISFSTSVRKWGGASKLD